MFSVYQDEKVDSNSENIKLSSQSTMAKIVPKFTAAQHGDASTPKRVREQRRWAKKMSDDARICQRGLAKPSELAVESFYPQSYGTFKQRDIL